MTSKGKKRKDVGASTAYSELRAPSSALEKQKILIVDDKKENLVALRRVLEGVDAEIFEATSGNAALAATLDNQFAVAILDVQMPGMGGYELAKHLRGDEKTKVIPIVFVTASYADEQHMFEGYEAGGIDYIIKPFDPQVLLGKVRIFIEIAYYREELRRHRDHLEVLVGERTNALKERIKEIECLYAVSGLVARPGESIDEALRAAVDLVPPGLQYPEITCAKITFEDREFATVGFRETPWKLSADIPIPSSGSRVPNSVLVCYLEERPELDEGPFSKEERNLVIDIARQFGVMIERDRAEEALRREQKMLARTERIAHIGSWEWDIEKDRVTWSDELFRIFQRDPREGAPSFAEHPAFYHPDDMARLQQAVEVAVADGTPYELELRAIQKDGETRVCMARGVAEMALGGRAVHLFGSLQDITERKQAEASLRESEERFRSLYENATIGLYRTTTDGRIILANNALVRMLGYSSFEELSTRNLEKSGFEPSHSRREFIKSVASDGEVKGLESAWVHKDGATIFVRESAHATYGLEANVLYYDGTVEDVTERKRAEEALRNSEARYRQLVENANEAIIVAQDGLLTFVNRAAVEMTGYPETELTSRPFLEFVHPDDREMVADNYRKRLAGDTAQPRYTFRLLADDGGVKWAEIGAVLIDWEGRPATLNFLTDITDRRKAEEVIQASLREKEVLLREIHHRVKNNMQVISSLFNLQAGNTQNTECREILKEGQTRLRAMSLVHEKLYKSLDLSKIDLAVYIQSLAGHLFNVFLTDPDRVRLETDFEEVLLDINSAVPCGLILNELISNSLKHAFPEGRKGLIRIGLKRGPDDMIILRVADDGIGFPNDVDIRQSESLGLQIANLLVGQLDGTIELDRTNGTAVTVTFREIKYAPRS